MEDKAKAPHGKQQNIKMNLLKWLNEGTNPFEIIHRLAEYLEEESAEPGYANVVLADIRNIYGIGLSDKNVLSDELLELRTRLDKLETALKNTTDEEIQSRLKFAIEHHKKKIEQLNHELK